VRYGGGIVDVHGKRSYAGGQVGCVTAAVQECHFYAALDRQVRASCADDAGSADEEDFHEFVVADWRRGAVGQVGNLQADC
jgi:hypothetical protein